MHLLQKTIIHEYIRKINNSTFIERKKYPTLSMYSPALQELLICLDLP